MNTRPNTLAIYTRHLLSRYGRTGAFWTIGFGLYVVMIVLTFPSFEASGMLETMNYPEALAEAFNLDDMTSIESFLGAQIYSYAPLVLAFFPIMTFASAIAGAEERGALDILLGNPIPRRHVVLASWIALTIVLLGVFMIVGAMSWLTALAIDVDLSARAAFRGSLNMFPITLAFGTLALFLSAALRQRGVVIGISFGVMFLMYLFEVVGRIADAVAGLRFVSAFRYYENPIVDGTPWIGVAVLLLAAIVLLIAAIPIFEQRDLYT